MRAKFGDKVHFAQSLGISLTSYAVDKGLEFPFISLPDFNVRTSKVRDLTDSDGITWLPLVDQTERKTWEAYAANNAHLWTTTESGFAPPIPPLIHDGEENPIDGPLLQDDSLLSGKYVVSWYVPVASSDLLKLFNMRLSHSDFAITQATQSSWKCCIDQ